MVIRQDYMIEEEPFLLEQLEDGRFMLSHPGWSTLGIGHSIMEAEWDLIQEGQEVFPFYANHPAHKMTPGALRLTEWLYRIIPYKRAAA